MKEIVDNTAKAFNCKAEVNIKHLYPAVINHAKET